MFLSTISEKTRKRDLRGEMAQGISHTAIILFAEKGWFLGALMFLWRTEKNYSECTQETKLQHPINFHYKHPVLIALILFSCIFMATHKRWIFHFYVVKRKVWGFQSETPLSFFLNISQQMEKTV